MSAANTDKVRKKKSLFQTTLNGGINDSDTSLTLQSASGLPTDTAVTLVINRVDANGNATASAMEVVTGTVSGSTVSNLLRGKDSTTAKSHANASVVEMVWDAATWNDFCDAYLSEHNQDGTHKSAAVSSPITAASGKTTPVNADYFPIIDTEASNVLKTLTFTNLKAFLKTYFDTLYGSLTGSNVWTGSNIMKLNLPEGSLINGTFTVTDTGSGLALAIKGLDGNDPSASNPVYVVLNGVVRSITAALSVTAADGTNWGGAGGTMFAAKELDWFPYLGYNATDGVVVGFSRFPGARQYGDFSTTSTAETYCKISTITTAASTDYYCPIGRFAATLSAGAGYTWSVPTYTAVNLVVQPGLRRSRYMTYTPTGPTGCTITGRFMVDDRQVRDLSMKFAFTGAASFTNMPTLPFALSSNFLTVKRDYNVSGTGGYLDSGTANKTQSIAPHLGTDQTTVLQLDSVANSGAISNTNPITWANGDEMWVAVPAYEI